MTTEILMLNKDGVVVAADSAVTTEQGQSPHPRYSKSANKIFDLSHHGFVALTIFASAEIDYLPWQLAIREFRKFDSTQDELPKLIDYSKALISFLESNSSLFPDTLLSNVLQGALTKSVLHILNRAKYRYTTLVKANATDEDRINAWVDARNEISASLNALPAHSLLDGTELDAFVDSINNFREQLSNHLSQSLDYHLVDPDELLELAKLQLLKNPEEVLRYTGLVFAGYGATEIFPSYDHIIIYGHVGHKLIWATQRSYEITHTNDAWIQAFAQSSMIDRFTDGFDSSLRMIISDESRNMINKFSEGLQSQNIIIDEGFLADISNRVHQDFMDSWTGKNWDNNFHPLRRVLNGLSIQEMGYLAESLLVLEELRERVTSPSESVGGPIDVAVVTKSEGLIWLKRKHYFETDLNHRYLNRVKKEYNPN